MFSHGTASCLIACVVGGVVASAHGQDEVDGSLDQSVGDRLSVSASLDFTNQYFFRGILQESGGFIFQPGAEIGALLHDGESVAVSASVGVWSSFHDRDTGSSDPDDFDSAWYEFDAYAGLSFTFGRIGTGVTYTAYTSPNDAFDTIDEIMVSLSFDDAGLWGESDFALAPWMAVAFEVGGSGADGGMENGIYLGLGVEPGFGFGDGTVLEGSTLSFPVELGLSLSDYYEVGGEDDTFGYLTAGVAVSVPLGFVPIGFGEWSLNAGVDLLVLGDHTEMINNGSDTEWLFHGGLSVAF